MKIPKKNNLKKNNYFSNLKNFDVSKNEKKINFLNKRFYHEHFSKKLDL